MNCGTMQVKELENLVRAFRNGEVELHKVAQQIPVLNYQQFSLQDFPAVVSGKGKTRPQVIEAVEHFVQRSPNVLVIQTDAGTFGEVRNVCTEAEWHEAAGVIRVWRDHTDRGIGKIGVVAAAASAIPVAEEAALMAEVMGNRLQRVWEAGVANAYRLLAEQEIPQVIIIALESEAAWPLFVGELVSMPVVAVPTTIAHGASFGGTLSGESNRLPPNLAIVNLKDGQKSEETAAAASRTEDQAQGAGPRQSQQVCAVTLQRVEEAEVSD